MKRNNKYPESLEFETIKQKDMSQLYYVRKIYRNGTKDSVIQRNLLLSEATEIVESYPDQKDSMVIFTKQF